ncbi:hypothetical protein ABIC89_000842 [Variovorax boronicumulans]
MATKIIPHRAAKTAPAPTYDPIPCEPGVVIIGNPGQMPSPDYVVVPWLVKMYWVG